MYRLWFKAAVMAGDVGCVRTCMERAVAGTRETTRFGSYFGFLELARCSGEIQSQFPAGALRNGYGRWPPRG